MQADTERLPYFRQFQILRLQDTYRDFIQQPAYREACDFFFGDIYSVENSAERDRAFEAFAKKISKVVGGDVEQCLKRMVLLQKHTEELDRLLLRELQQQGAAWNFDMADYQKAYRACDNYAERMNQIQELVQTLLLSHRVLRRFGIGPGLLALHRFQEFRGQGLATGVLVRGYKALSPLPSINPLAQAIESRERDFLDRVYQKGIPSA